MASSGLHVIALVSGGKDSFFSALHCLENGHRLVALANLHPPLPSDAAPSAASQGRTGGGALAAAGGGHQSSVAPAVGDGATAGAWARPGSGGVASPGADEDADLNSFMYQTVGHQVIPLYAEATGIPLYRRPIVGGAVHTGRDYAAAATAAAGSQTEEDETESMVPLLRAIIRDHPEANALSAGAILSTYQRTRVESVALRLGLTPLAYLWKYPLLPPPTLASKDEAQLLLDMAAAGLDPRIIKVASGGLDESFLWETVASAKGVMRLKKAMGRFGSAGLDTGAVLGEGGEFETLVVDGPTQLFKKRIVVDEEDRVVVREGGGQAWLKMIRARLEDKTAGEEQDLNFRKPNLYDERFATVLHGLKSDARVADAALAPTSKLHHSLTIDPFTKIQTWAYTNSETTGTRTSTIQEETSRLVDEIQSKLTQRTLTPASIISTAIILRSMADFPAINAIYGSLFTTPNPPSRVTISCGDLLPPHGGSIAIYVTLHTGETDRQGLHVQSRSYWAPANIGPYSQAISFPVTARGARAVHIAGQIPLIPASMELPTEGLETQLVLSLQHLWRIGAEVNVQWWTSAAVYFPSPSRSKCPKPPSEKAVLAWKAWRDAHRWSPSSPGDDEDEGGPDLWDRKFNTQYMSYGDAAEEASLPDYSLLKNGEEDKPLPFFFAVEVDELPRSAEAEWHAHAGLSGLKSDTDSVHFYSEESEVATVEHCVLTSEDGGLLHSVVALRSPEVGSALARRPSLDRRIDKATNLFSASLAKLVKKGDVSAPPYVVYANTGVFELGEISEIMARGLAIIPCASIHGGSQGVSLELIALYRESFTTRKA
ncbi:unnamed protein product [Discula destructiva]